MGLDGFGFAGRALELSILIPCMFTKHCHEELEDHTMQLKSNITFSPSMIYI